MRLATTEELKQQCYRIRHDVYCGEFGWEPSMPDEMETDEYDPDSIHCLVLSPTEPVGTVRLICTIPLPLQLTCGHAIHPESQSYLNNLQSLCEISRLAVKREYRQFPITMMLCLCVLAVAERIQCGHGVAMMVPSMPRLLRRIGIEFCPIGHEIEHHGTRAPFYITAGYTKDNLIPRLKPLYKDIQILL